MVDHPNSLTPKHALVVFAGVFALACGLIPSSKTPQLERFECQVKALEPYVGSVFDAEQLMRDVYKGAADLNSVAGFLHLAPEQIKAANAAMRKCNGDVEPEGAVESKVVAPPPAYGNKIL